MLGKVDFGRRAIDEADGGVLPVANVIAETDAEDGVAEVVGVEEEPESVDYAIFFWHDDQDRWSTASSAFNGTVLVTLQVPITFPEVAMRS